MLNKSPHEQNSIIRSPSSRESFRTTAFVLLDEYGFERCEDVRHRIDEFVTNDRPESAVLDDSIHIARRRTERNIDEEDSVTNLSLFTADDVMVK